MGEDTLAFSLGNREPAASGGVDWDPTGLLGSGLVRNPKTLGRPDALVT